MPLICVSGCFYLPFFKDIGIFFVYNIHLLSKYKTYILIFICMFAKKMCFMVKPHSGAFQNMNLGLRPSWAPDSESPEDPGQAS